MCVYKQRHIPVNKDAQTSSKSHIQTYQTSKMLSGDPLKHFQVFL